MAYLLTLYISPMYKFMVYSASIFLSPLVSLPKDVDYESPEAKKHGRGSTSTKRSRAAEVHNLSERVYLHNFNESLNFILLSSFSEVSYCIFMQRRRDRINEKMKALQELIPRCNKVNRIINFPSISISLFSMTLFWFYLLSNSSFKFLFLF